MRRRKFPRRLRALPIIFGRVRRATPEMMRPRRCAVEYPFGTTKPMMAGGRFLTRGLQGTRTEMALSVLAYNILRAINIKAAVA